MSRVLLRTLFSALILCTVIEQVPAQNEAYLGGAGSGSDMAIKNHFGKEFTGGSGDGSDISVLNIASLSAMGGEGSGYSMADVYGRLVAFNGGSGDGHHHMYWEGSNQGSKGGIGSGYALSLTCPDILWSGNMGSGWNVAANWSSSQIPCNCNNVIIPSGSPVFPAVNAGMLKIGYDLNDAEYNCAAIRIEENAQLITRVNSFIENHGILIIKGTMEVRNNDPAAFINRSSIQIRPNGLLNFIKE